MESFYLAIFTVAAVLAGVLEYGNRVGKGNATATNSDFSKFRKNYLLVYSLMMAGDWLQGPYVYALYQHYGFSRGEIGRLFTAGFGSSMIFGTIVGSLADTHGRKRAALTYVAAYTFGCFTKHFNSFWILFIGRIACGVATSLLYSAFESWLVAEHFKRGFNGDWLGNIFSQAVFLGNGLMAIAAGLFAHMLVETFQVGPVAPFDAAALVLLIGGAVIATTWPENYGESKSTVAGAPEEKASITENFKKAAKLITSDPKIALLGAMQSFFEGSMYSFVFLWTPALSPNGERIPHGMIFACFMVSCMAGSAVAGKLLSNENGYKVEKYMQIVFGLSAACLFVPVMYHRTMADGTGSNINSSADDGISTEGKIQLLAFCLFEALVGVFWPSMMQMRAGYLPEEMRSTIINFFRIPLNLFVCVVLANVSVIGLSQTFAMSTLLLIIAGFCCVVLDIITPNNNKRDAVPTSPKHS
jgi:MFS transporter, MFS domain-containing protein family, molybdate-anion transporter